MPSYVDTKQAKQRKTASGLLMSGRGRPRPALQLLDKRREGMAHSILQNMANDRPEARRLSSLQAMADDHMARQGPMQVTPIQRVVLTLPHPKGLDNTWTVDTRGPGKEYLKGWIDQAAKTHPNGLFILLERLRAIPEPDALEEFLQDYADQKGVQRRELSALEQEANPADIANVQAYIESQMAYQDALLDHGYEKGEIMAQHRSMGAEFEFAVYSGLQEEAPSHIVLASSQPLSRLFPLKFELETDAGHVLEIGMPPFLVKNLPTGKPDKAKIAMVHNTMRRKMAEVREQSDGKLIAFLVTKLQETGFGKEWQINGKAGTTIPDFHAMQVGGNPLPEKLSTGRDRIYEQLNLSMTGEESAAFIKMMAEHPEWEGNAEKGVLGSIYTALAGKTGTIPAGMAVHIKKAMTNILAIPSILLSQRGMGEHTPEGYEVESLVKELYGLWVKDSLPNILKSFAPHVPENAAAQLEEAKKLITEEIDKVFSKLQQSIPTSTLDALTRLKKNYVDEGEYGGERDEVLKDFNSDGPHYNVLEKLIEELDAGLKAGAKLEEQEVSDPWQQFYQVHDRFRHYIQTQYQAEIQKSLPDQIRTKMLVELDKLMASLKTQNILPSPRVAYQTETFGGSVETEGLGVRKDTLVPTIATDTSSMSVGEIRGQLPIRKFLEE